MAMTDTQRENEMRDRIEKALLNVASQAGLPSVRIESWTHGEAEPELRVRVGNEPRVLEVSRPFLQDKPDAEMLRKVSVAARELIQGEAPRVQLFHRGVFAAWGGS